MISEEAFAGCMRVLFVIGFSAVVAGGVIMVFAAVLGIIWMTFSERVDRMVLRILRGRKTETLKRIYSAGRDRWNSI